MPTGASLETHTPKAMMEKSALYVCRKPPEPDIQYTQLQASLSWPHIFLFFLCLQAHMLIQTCTHPCLTLWGKDNMI